MIKKNPNCYFYRHNAPGQDAWHGDWAEDEIQRFVEVAKEHGCGDKWGLFASYIPHRVGYQCSAAYRHVIIPRGLAGRPVRDVQVGRGHLRREEREQGKRVRKGGGVG